MVRESSSSPEAGVRKYRRSRTGCFTCRKRKKRCDEGKPICTACKRLNLHCKYPSTNTNRNANDRKMSSSSEESGQWSEHPRMTHSELFKNADGQLPKMVVNGDLEAIEISSDLHFPLHCSRMEGETAHSLPANETNYVNGNGIITDGIHSRILANSNDKISEVENVNHSGDEIPGHENGLSQIEHGPMSSISQQINVAFDGQHADVSQSDSLNQDGALGDFSTPLLFTNDVNGMTSANPSMIQRLDSPSTASANNGLFTSIAADGSNSTVVDELTEPFASALMTFPRTPSSTASSSRGSSTETYKSRYKGGREHVNDIRSAPDGSERDDSDYAVSEISNAIHRDSVASEISRTPPQSSSPELAETKLNDNQHSPQFLASAGPTTARFCAVYPDLDAKSVSLYNYFRDKQSRSMSVSPSNYFRSVFLAFSLRYRAIMYGILAWAAWHKGDEEDLARSFFEKGSQILRNETINSRSKEEILAALLVLASAKICSGDTSAWRAYSVMAGETIHLHGGLTSFMESESVRWLLKNYAYHEILTSSSLSQPKLFSANDFESIFNQPSSATLPDTLCACCQPVFVVLERINELTRSVRLMKVNDKLSEIPDKDVESIYLAAHDLEQKIWALRPAHKISQHLSDSDLMSQHTLFDVFKLVAVLHMYQSVLQINSASISLRVVAQRLENAMDGSFGTMVEGILTFPLFILGISSSTSRAREYVIKKFTAMEKRSHARNVTQARVLLSRVWDKDHHGTLHVDWNELIDHDGLHFCFC